MLEPVWVLLDFLRPKLIQLILLKVNSGYADVFESVFLADILLRINPTTHLNSPSNLFGSDTNDNPQLFHKARSRWCEIAPDFPDRHPPVTSDAPDKISFAFSRTSFFETLIPAVISALAAVQRPTHAAPQRCFSACAEGPRLPLTWGVVAELRRCLQS